MSDRKVGPIAKALIDAKARIADPKNWCSEDESRTGRHMHKVCAVVALEFAGWASLRALETAAADHFRSSVVDVNRIGHAAVMAMYDHAINRALSEGV